jgi:hypothetical protein
MALSLALNDLLKVRSNSASTPIDSMLSQREVHCDGEHFRYAVGSPLGYEKHLFCEHCEGR